MEENQTPVEPQVSPIETPATLEAQVVVETEASTTPTTSQEPEMVIVSANPVPVPSEPIIQQPEPLIVRETTTASPSHLRELLDKALVALDFRKQKRFEKIMTLAQKKGSINNDDTQKFLRVSDATASRYLGALARQGKLNRVGKGKATVFKPL